MGEAWETRDSILCLLYRACLQVPQSFLWYQTELQAVLGLGGTVTKTLRQVHLSGRVEGWTVCRRLAPALSLGKK